MFNYRKIEGVDSRVNFVNFDLFRLLLVSGVFLTYLSQVGCKDSGVEIGGENEVLRKVVDVMSKSDKSPEAIMRNEEYATYLEYLENEDTWTKEEAERVGLLIDGDPKKGFRFLDEVTDGEERKNYKVVPALRDELLGKDNWSTEETVTAECCFLRDGRLVMYKGYYSKSGAVKPIDSAYLDTKDKWSESDLVFSGLRNEDGSLLDGFEFVESVESGGERKNFKAIRIEENEEVSDMSKEMDQSVEIDEGSSKEIQQKVEDKVESDVEMTDLSKELIDLWDSHEKGQVKFKYFDINDDLKMIGETVYKGKSNAVKTQAIHDKFRAGKDGFTLEYNESSITLANSMFRSQVSWNKEYMVDTPEDVFRRYEELYARDMRLGYDSYLEVMSGSDLVKAIKKYGLEDEFYDLVIAQIAQESSFKDGRVSSAGARGIAQITEPASTDIAKKIKSSSLRTKHYNDYKGTVGSRDIIEMMTFYDLVIPRIASEKNQKIFYGSENAFRNVFVPILLTSYNQGNVSGSNLVDYFLLNHNEEKFDEKYYEGGKRKVANIKPEFANHLIGKVYLLSRATKEQRKAFNERDKKYSKKFANASFGLDGLWYYLKIEATRNKFGEFELDDSFGAPYNYYYYKRKSLENNLKGTKLYGNGPLFSQRSYETYYKDKVLHFLDDKEEIKALVGEDYRYIRLAVKGTTKSVGLDDQIRFYKNGRHLNKGINSDKYYEIDDRNRMYIWKKYLPLYAEISRRVYESTGKHLQITSTFRDVEAQKAQDSVERSFHLYGQAFDLREANFEESEKKIVEMIIAEYASEGKVSIINHDNHFHIVFHDKKFHDILREYFADLSYDAQKRLKAKVAKVK